METRDFGIHISVIQPGGTASEWAEIANQRAQEVSGSGPYGELVRAFAKLNEQNAATVPAEAIAQIIRRAVEDHRPRARYVGPGAAKIGLFLRRWLSDHSYDRLILWMIRRALKSPAFTISVRQ